MSHLFENDVDVTGNELGDLFPFSGLYRVVALLVLPKVLHTHTHTSLWIVRKVTTAECAVQAKDLLQGLEHWLTSKSCNIQRIGLNQQQSWGRRFTGH